MFRGRLRLAPTRDQRPGGRLQAAGGLDPVPGVGYNEAVATRYWLVKQEPGDYSWQTFVKDGGTAWTGVRNFQARNHLRAMRRGDRVLFYHSGASRAVVGVARVAREAYPDSTASDGDWWCVDLEPLKTLEQTVPLSGIKSDPLLRTMALVRQSRLSVSPVEPEQFERVLELGGGV